VAGLWGRPRVADLVTESKNMSVYLVQFKAIKLNINVTKWSTIILCFENSTFGAIINWSGRVESQKMDPIRDATGMTTC